MTLPEMRMREWAAGHNVSKKIAADLAARIWSGRLPRWHDMPANLDLALEWGASERTAGRAKELLAACGLITKSPGGYYYVA